MKKIMMTNIYSISNYFRDNMKRRLEIEQMNKVPYYRRYEKNVGKLK